MIVIHHALYYVSFKELSKQAQNRSIMEDAKGNHTAITVTQSK